MSLKPLKCPNCGAALTNINPNLESFYCTYCGYHIINADVSRSIHKEIYIDQAKIAQEEAWKEVELQKLRSEEKKRESERKEYIAAGIIIGTLVLVGYIMMAIVL